MGEKEAEVKCELVHVDYGYEQEIEQLVQYENTPEELEIRAKVIDKLESLGHKVDCTAHEVVFIGDDPAVSWLDLEDIVLSQEER